MRFIIPAPPSANAMYRAVNNRVIKAKPYREWLGIAQVKIAADLLRDHPRATRPGMDERYTLRIWYFPHSARKRDIDNLLKPVLDAFEGLIYDNDNQVDVILVYRRPVNRQLEHDILDVFVEPI